MRSDDASESVNAVQNSASKIENTPNSTTNESAEYFNKSNFHRLVCYIGKNQKYLVKFVIQNTFTESKKQAADLEEILEKQTEAINSQTEVVRAQTEAFQDK